MPPPAPKAEIARVRAAPRDVAWMVPSTWGVHSGVVTFTGVSGRDELVAGLLLDIGLAVAVLVVALVLRARGRRRTA